MKEKAVYVANAMGLELQPESKVIKMDGDSVEVSVVKHICSQGGLNLLGKRFSIIPDENGKFYQVYLWHCANCGKTYWYTEDASWVLGVPQEVVNQRLMQENMQYQSEWEQQLRELMEVESKVYYDSPLEETGYAQDDLPDDFASAGGTDGTYGSPDVPSSELYPNSEEEYAPFPEDYQEKSNGYQDMAEQDPLGFDENANDSSKDNNPLEEKLQGGKLSDFL